MMVGDLVRLKPIASASSKSKRIGITMDIIQKKCWRTEDLGPTIDWSMVDPEPHASVLFPGNSVSINIPVVDLEVINEHR